MSRRLANLTLDNLGDMVLPCRACVFWELDPAAAHKVHNEAQASDAKEAWVAETLLEWGCCGQLIYVDSVAAGHVLYAPPAYVPRAMSFATSPISPDAVLLMSAHIHHDFAGGGLGRMLVQGLARDVTRRGIRAIEVFGRATGAASACLPPVGYLRSVGFKTVRPHPTTPRLRLDIRSIVAWKEDVESAIERLLGTIAAPALGRI